VTSVWPPVDSCPAAAAAAAVRGGVTVMRMSSSCVEDAGAMTTHPDGAVMRPVTLTTPRS